MRIDRVSTPLFRPDPGWLFVIAGLLLIAAAVLIPPQMRLHTLTERHKVMVAAERASVDRLRAYTAFLESVESRDPQLVRRLVAAQLNLIPEGLTPVMVAPSAMAPITAWIESTVDPAPVIHERFPDSRLGQLASGTARQWLFGFAGACLFIGLVLGPPENGDPDFGDEMELPNDEADVEPGFEAAP